MSRNLKSCLGMFVLTLAMLVAESANAGGLSCLQESDQSEPEITIVLAEFGKGRTRLVCTNEIAKIVSSQMDPEELTYITPAGTGTTDPSGKSWDSLKIWYRLDGQVVRRPDGKEALLFLKPGVRTNIRASLYSHARGWLGENFEGLSKTENPKPAETQTDKSMESDASPGSSSATSSPANSEASNAAWDMTAISRTEFSNKPKNFEKSLATVQGLMIQETGAGQQFGMAVDVIVQVGEQHHNQADFQRGDKIGKEMKISMEEAIRAVRARYPKWENRSIRFSFGDKYSEMSGGSAGATFALLTISVLEGFEIDPDFAVTGDILVNWKVKGVGAIPEKIRGGITDKKKTVAIPAENAESISDVMVKFPLETLWQIQIFSTPDLQTLIGLARTDRPAGLTEAMGLFTALQSQLESRGEELLSEPSVREQLKRIVELAPNHESAVHLLMVCNGNRPTQLSRGESLRELSVLMNPLDEVLWNVKEEKFKSISTTRIQDMLVEVEEFLKICHTDVQPAGLQFDRYLNTIKRLVSSPNNSAYNAFDKSRLELIEQFRKISVNREMMESLLRH